MTGTAARNGVLFFIVPSRRRFVVLGDEGIQAKVGQEFWESVARCLSERFRKGEFTEGLLEAIATAGESLARHFPYEEGRDRNELGNEVDFGRGYK
jgi:uncharacterized membrane protein